MCSISAHSAIITPAASGSVTMQRDCHNRSSLTVHSIVIDSKTEMIAQVQHGCDISQQRVRLPWRQCPFCCPLFTHACIMLHTHACIHLMSPTRPQLVHQSTLRTCVSNPFNYMSRSQSGSSEGVVLN